MDEHSWTIHLKTSQLDCDWEDVKTKEDKRRIPRPIRRAMRPRTHEQFMKQHRQEEWLAGLDQKLDKLRQEQQG